MQEKSRRFREMIAAEWKRRTDLHALFAQAQVLYAVTYPGRSMPFPGYVQRLLLDRTDAFRAKLATAKAWKDLLPLTPRTAAMPS
jgi:hypothetical protein